MNLRYSALDLSFYEVDTPTRRQHIAALISFENDYPLSILEKNISKLPDEFPTILRRSFIKNRTDLNPPFFKHCPITEPVTEFVEKRMMSDEFYKNRMWEIIYLEETVTKKQHVLFRLHHSFSDGVSGLNFFHDIVFNIRKNKKNRKPNQEKLSFIKSLGAMYAEALLPPIKKKAKPPESNKRKIFFLKVALSDINSVKKLTKTGTHEISLLISAEIYFFLFPEEKIFRALIPVALKEGRSHGILGNYIGGTSIEINRNTHSLTEKLKNISSTLAKKNNPNTYGAYLYFSKILKYLPTLISKKIARFESAKMSAIVTSLNGPKTVEQNLRYSEFAIPALMPGQYLGYGFIKNKHFLDITIITDANLNIDHSAINDSISQALNHCEIKNWSLK